jgi:hypothetical protein
VLGLESLKVLTVLVFLLQLWLTRLPEIIFTFLEATVTTSVTFLPLGKEESGVGVEVPFASEQASEILLS